MQFVKDYEVDKIKLWEQNPRKNDKAVEKLEKLIKEYGFVNPVIIDEKGILRAGHTRVKVAKKLGIKTVPAVIYEFGDLEKAIGYAIADNKSAEWAEWDEEELKDLFK